MRRLFLLLAPGIALADPGPLPAPQHTIPLMIGTTKAIGGGKLLAGACTSGTVAVANAAPAMVVMASPATYPGDQFEWTAYVSTPGTVTVRVCGSIAGTPAAATYNVRVIQ